MEVRFARLGGAINPLASAIKCAWRVTTVSPGYLEELYTNANGLESLISHERAKMVGILNGIDTLVWDPATDHMLTQNYDPDTVAVASWKTNNSSANASDWMFRCR